MPIDADTLAIDPWVFRRKLLDRSNLVRNGVISQIAVKRIVEALGAIRCAQAIHADDHEAQLRKRLHIAVRRSEPAVAAGASLRPRIDEVDDGISGAVVEIARLEEKAIQISLAVPRLGRDRRERLPSSLNQLRDVLIRNMHDDLAVTVAHNSLARRRRRRCDIEEQLAVVRSGDLVVGRFGC